MCVEIKSVVMATSDGDDDDDDWFEFAATIETAEVEAEEPLPAAEAAGECENAMHRKIACKHAVRNEASLADGG